MQSSAKPSTSSSSIKRKLTVFQTGSLKVTAVDPKKDIETKEEKVSSLSKDTTKLAPEENDSEKKLKCDSSIFNSLEDLGTLGSEEADLPERPLLKLAFQEAAPISSGELNDDDKEESKEEKKPDHYEGEEEVEEKSDDEEDEQDENEDGLDDEDPEKEWNEQLDSMKNISLFIKPDAKEEKSFGHRVITHATQIQKDSMGRYRVIDHPKYLLKIDEEIDYEDIPEYFFHALCEVSTCEFSRMISPSHPQVKLGISMVEKGESYKICYEDPVCVASEFLSDINKRTLYEFPAEEVINKIFITGEWKGFASCMAIALAFHNVDFRLDNLALLTNQTVINFDCDLSFVKTINLTEEDIDLLPYLSHSNPLRKSGHWLSDWDELMEEKHKSLLMNSRHFKEELFATFLKIIITPVEFLDAFFDCLDVRSKDKKIINKITKNKALIKASFKNLETLLLKNQHFRAYLLKTRDEEQAETFLKNIMEFVTGNEQRLPAHHVPDLKVKIKRKLEELRTKAANYEKKPGLFTAGLKLSSLLLSESDLAVLAGPALKAHTQ